MIIKMIEGKDRERADRFLEEYWGYTLVVLREGEVFDVKLEQGLIAEDEQGSIQGALMYKIQEGVCEILMLCAVQEKHGIGTQLIEHLKKIAKSSGCGTIRVVTTNDNLNALGFYQKRGFHLKKLYVNAMDYVRALKPYIPLTGGNGIPLSDELELEMTL
ncbi:MAG: GNAT family N-acetyltransferase [Clostridiaceae bacterium]|nr:GNAT family N-acetyltransferase [Clostridiaceae bacterium]